MFKNIFRFIVRSPLHKAALELKAFWISSNWVKENNRILGNKTVYCISPYKTGTTFIASAFERSVAKHEPFHHTSVKKLNQDFDRFFVRRLNSLNLKLECSGFFSAYVDKLAQNEIAKDLTFICVLRNPSSWVTSLVNHFQKVKEYGQYYNWENELFWQKYVGINLANFFMSDESEKLEMIEKLIEFYMTFTKKTEKLRNVTYVWIKDLPVYLLTLGQLIGAEAKIEDCIKNETLIRKFVYINEALDAEYEQLTCVLLSKP